MKTGFKILIALTSLLPCQSGWAQGSFQNLDFENSIIVSSSPSGFGFNTGTANVPGWTEYNGWNAANYSGGATLVYNNMTLDAPGIELEGADYFIPAIEGQYSILISGGDTQSMQTGAAIGQTGTIPITAQSLTFFLSYQYGNLQVSFNGQPIDYLLTGSTASYNVYAADISAFAGQTGQLLFNAPYYNRALIDNIQFSTSPVPEPSAFALTVLGTLVLTFRRRS